MPVNRRYEYIRIEFDWADLDQLNRLAGEGWHVVAARPDPDKKWGVWALLERELPAVSEHG